MATAYIGLGSNIGRREKNIRQAIANLKKTEGINVIKASSIYETIPVGYLDQQDFLNAVIEIETTLSPWELLTATKSIEKKQRRQRRIHWGPRTIDLDILLYDQLETEEPDLKLPHPEITKRAFVLTPLAEIAPDMIIQGGKPVKDALADLGRIKGVKLYAKNAIDPTRKAKSG